MPLYRDEPGGKRRDSVPSRRGSGEVGGAEGGAATPCCPAGVRIVPRVNTAAGAVPVLLIQGTQKGLNYTA